MKHTILNLLQISLLISCTTAQVVLWCSDKNDEELKSFYPHKISIPAREEDRLIATNILLSEEYKKRTCLKYETYINSNRNNIIPGSISPIASPNPSPEKNNPKKNSLRLTTHTSSNVVRNLFPDIKQEQSQIVESSINGRTTKKPNMNDWFSEYLISDFIQHLFLFEGISKPASDQFKQFKSVHLRWLHIQNILETHLKKIKSAEKIYITDEQDLIAFRYGFESFEELVNTFDDQRKEMLLAYEIAKNSKNKILPKNSIAE